MSIAIALRLFLATLFARAAWHKLSQRKVFQSELAAYRLLPESFIWLTMYGLIAVEIFCTLGLLFSNFAIVAAMALLLIYAAAMAISLWRGNRHIDCGCGGWLSPRKTLSWVLVSRNLLLVLMAFICLLLPIPSSLNIENIFVTLLIAFTLWLLYETAEQAMGNFQHYQQWKKSSSSEGMH